MATTVLRSAAAVLGALAYVASATGTRRASLAPCREARAHRAVRWVAWAASAAPPSVHMLTGAPNAHAAAPEAIAPAKLGSRWIDAARHPVTASSQLTIVLDGTPDNGREARTQAPLKQGGTSAKCSRGTWCALGADPQARTARLPPTLRRRTR